MNEEVFNLENQYQLYLQRVGLRESDMPKTQKKELRRCFMAGCGQILVLMRDQVAVLEEDQTIQALESMEKQVSSYFLNILNQN